MKRKETIFTYTAQLHPNMDKLHAAVFATLEYFGLFCYPLRSEEVWSFCPVKCQLSDIYSMLKKMNSTSEIFEYSSYYSLKNNIEFQVGHREKGNILATEKVLRAKKVANFIYHFPFVRFVGISGSLSKGYAEKKSDFDFFIITSLDRLWISRTLLHLFKKITFVAGQQDKFCMNYFIDEGALEIEEKNKFTATELATLILVKGDDIFIKFINANKWVQDYLPNKNLGSIINKNTKESLSFKKAFEYIFNHLSPLKLNRALMRLTDKKWRNKWDRKKFPMDDYNIAFKTTLHISKNHPHNHQKKVLSRLNKIKDQKI